MYGSRLSSSTQTAVFTQLAVPIQTAAATKTKEYLCDKCETAELYVCDMCDSALFHTYAAYVKHMGTSHGKKCLECYQCKIKFDKQSTLLAHLESRPHDADWAVCLLWPEETHANRVDGWYGEECEITNC